MASTPPPPSPTSLRVPGAPLHGAGYDLYSPYPTRYSTRLASQRASRTAEKTPPPICPSSPSKMRSKSSPKKNVKGEEKTLSPPRTGSPGTRSNPGTRDRNYPAPKPSMSLANDQSLSLPHSHVHSTHALPTPAKTPSKKVSSDISSTARTLFPPSTMSKKKPSPFSLESFDESAPGQKEIQIFTDSRDRIPKPSTSSENPFATRTERTAPRATRASKNSGSTDGIRYNFRGKTVIKDFVSDDEDEANDTDDDLGLFKARPDLLASDPDLLNNVKPLSRSSITPRALWPSKDKAKPAEEEEAATDDEQPVEQVPDSFKSPLSTPLSPEFPRAPGASRLLRSSTRFEDDMDVTPTGTSSPGVKRKRVSPFDRWQRKKGKEDGTPTAPATPAKRHVAHGESHSAGVSGSGHNLRQNSTGQFRSV